MSEIDGVIKILEPPRPCNRQNFDAWQGNPYGKTVYIIGGYVWQGVGRGLKGDIGFQLYIHKNANTPAVELRIGMWDHYADPTGAEDNISPIRLGGHYFTLEADGSLLLRYGGALVGAQPTELALDGSGGTGFEVGTGTIAPFDYYLHIGGHHQQAFLYVTFTKPV